MITLDRIEETTAILLDDEGHGVEISLSELPKEVREGDVLERKNGEWKILSEETQQQAERIARLLKKIRT